MMALLYKKSTLIIFVFAGVMAFHSCKKNDPSPTNSQTITLSKSIGVEEMPIEISGSGFSNNPSDITVTFNGVTATIISSTATSIKVEVPKSTSGPVKITVKGSVLSSQPTFTYVDMTCADFEKLEYSNFNITSKTTSTIYYEMDLKNTGTKTLNLVHATIQNYVSANNTYESSDAAAGGFRMDIVDGADYMLAPGESIHITHHANNLTGTYLIVELKAYVGNYVNCNDAKQYIIVAK